MRTTKRDLVSLKRGLSAANAHVAALALTAKHAGESSLARRLATIARRLATEEDFVNQLIGRLP